MAIDLLGRDGPRADMPTAKTNLDRTNRMGSAIVEDENVMRFITRGSLSSAAVVKSRLEQIFRLIGSQDSFFGLYLLEFGFIEFAVAQKGEFIVF